MDSDLPVPPVRAGGRRVHVRHVSVERWQFVLGFQLRYLCFQVTPTVVMMGGSTFFGEVKQIAIISQAPAL